MTRHPVLFLVGLHGSGKTTLGRLLRDRHGWRQLSVGDLGRLARRNKLPQGVSLRLMLTLAQATPGKHIDDAAVALLLAQIDAWRRDTPVAVDGFPSLPAHLSRTPDRAGVVHVECARAICEPRLMLRSEQTQRKWTPGLASARDLALADLVSHAGTKPYFCKINNDGGLDDLKATANQLDTWASQLA
ncbi:AAA family ATPase [Variovorax gossypii]